MEGLQMGYQFDNRKWYKRCRSVLAVFFFAAILGGMKIEPIADDAISKCELVYKAYGEYIKVNDLGNMSYKKIERRRDFYLKYKIDNDLVAGSKVMIYVQEAVGDINAVNTVICTSENEDYFYDTEENYAYIPISLEEQQGCVKVYFDWTLANGDVLEKHEMNSGNAFWVELLGEYTISYDANGGTGGPDSQTKYTGTALTLSNAEPVREGYIFKGWAISNTTATVSYLPGELYTEDKSRTLYAVWELDLRPFVSAPLDQNVKIGDEAKFSVTVEGDYSEHYTYQWYCAGSKEGPGEAIVGETALSLIIPAEEIVAELNGMYYYCMVHDSYNECDVVSSRAKLTVFYKPTVTDPTEQKVKVGEGVEFRVTVSGGNPSEYTYQWYYALSESDTGIKINGAVSSVYTISSSQMVPELDGRYYYCEVGNGIYYLMSGRARLSVQKIEGPGSGENNGDGSDDSADNENNSGGGSTDKEENDNSGISGDDGDGNDDSQEDNRDKSQKQQKITASSFVREYGSKAFKLKAKTNGDGRLTYYSGNRKIASVSSKGKVSVKNYGTAVITIRASETAQYKAASKKVKIKVVPRKIALKKVISPAERKIEIKWKTDKTVSGYELNISSKSNFKSHTIRRYYKKGRERVVLVGVPSGKNFYVRIRSYKKIGKTKYYSQWSKVKTTKIK